MRPARTFPAARAPFHRIASAAAHLVADPPAAPDPWHESVGGRIVVMARRGVVKGARSADDYAKVYGRILAQVKEPVIIHWLGEMFDPALEGYWGHKDHYAAMAVALDVIAAHPEKVDGIKISLLDKDKEIAMRPRLPQGVRMFTGDDFNYAELIAGDAQS